MHNEELKEALLSKRPVILDVPSMGELHHKYVSAIIYRVNNGKFCISAEVKDKCNHSVAIVEPKMIRYED